ncbi:MAG: hypothetical protein RLZZ292_2252 [Bacteroidota bacterium]
MNKHTFIILCFMACLSPAMAQKSKKAPSKKNNQKIELKAPKEDKKGSKKRDISYYFEDGGIANPYNVIKFNPILLYTGDAPLYYERRLARFASIEVGAGVQLPYWKPDLYDLLSGQKEDFPAPTSGYSLYVNPRIYLAGNGVQGAYIGGSYRQRNFTVTPDDHAIFTDYAITYGSQSVVWKHFSVDWSLGIGSRSYKQVHQGTSSPWYDSRTIYPFHLKIGYVF